MRIAWRKILIVSGCAALALGLFTAVIHWPYASPSVVHLESQLFGPRFVMRNMWGSYDSWRSVLSGVESGEAAYLRVAVDLFPAIDGESADDMVEAVSKAIQRNPEGAITILLPRYGSGVVCGLDGMDRDPTVEVAKQRLSVVQDYARSANSAPNVSECLRAAQDALEGASAWAAKQHR